MCKSHMPGWLFCYLQVLSLSLPDYKTQNIIILRNRINNYGPVFCMLCLIVSFLLSTKKFPYCQFISNIKRILSHVTPGVPPGKTDGFSWYAVRANRPERVKAEIETWQNLLVCHFTKSSRNKLHWRLLFSPKLSMSVFHWFV